MAANAASGLADNLSVAILNQDDPETVRDGAPAYLLLMDSFVEGSPENGEILQAAAKLYAAYGAVFVEDSERAKRLSSRAHDYGKRALCIQHRPACEWGNLTYEDYEAALQELDARDVPALYSFALTWLVYIRAHSDEWDALAQLPRVEVVLYRIRALDASHERANIHLYLGILNTVRPPALGGQPEEGRRHFERALELSDGRDLGVKVEFARGYARLLYDRELHDRLLTEVIEADPHASGLTLSNTIAQRQARELLDSADDYF